MNLLNDFYILFDFIIEYYDVYKVEIIGDVYMVVSGFFNLNGIMYVGEIVLMLLYFLEVIKSFKIWYWENEMIKFWIGIYFGLCVVGVVGLKMLRYCLFGDIVNIVFRMEFNGECM